MDHIADPLDDDCYDEDGLCCDHDDYETDILDGRCRCVCGHSWYASNEQVEAEIEHQRAYDEWERGEQHRQWWRDLWDRVRSIFPRRGPQIIGDDEIPF